MQRPVTAISNPFNNDSGLVAACNGHPDHGRSNLPSGFIDEPSDGLDARALFGDEEATEPDPDEIDTVRIIPTLAGEEPDASILERAEPINSPSEADLEPIESESQDETIEIIIPRTPPPPPELLARLKEVHKRRQFSFSPRFQLMPWWIIEQISAFRGRI